MTYIKDTLCLENVFVSEAFMEQARQREDLEIIGEPIPLSFDDEGWLDSPFD